MADMSAVLVVASDGVAGVWARLRPGLERLAWSMTRDRDLREDLLQEALILLWERDPTRFDLRDDGEFGYVHRTLANRMRDTWRAEMKRCTQHEAVYTLRDRGLAPALWRPEGASAGGRVPSLTPRPALD